jgi:hypothetical protein
MRNQLSVAALLIVSYNAISSRIPARQDATAWLAYRSLRTQVLQFIRYDPFDTQMHGGKLANEFGNLEYRLLDIGCACINPGICSG